MNIFITGSTNIWVGANVISTLLKYYLLRLSILYHLYNIMISILMSLLLKCSLDFQIFSLYQVDKF